MSKAEIVWEKWRGGTGTRRRVAHSFYQPKRFRWLVCSGCGLILLKNEATMKAKRAACEVWDD